MPSVVDEETEIPYSWAIILGGTNDIATGGNAEDIWEALKKVYAFPLSNKSKVLALTVPESEGHNAVQTAHRDKLNKSILNYKADNLCVSYCTSSMSWPL